jgi:hypothetical protein
VPVELAVFPSCQVQAPHFSVSPHLVDVAGLESVQGSMVKIGVLSDTHLTDLRQGFQFLEKLAEEYLADVDMILHAGDLVEPLLLEAFGDVPVFAVRGNMDPPSANLPARRIVRAGSARIGLIHGWGPVGNLEERVAGEFFPDMPDCLVYGHSHLPVCHQKEGVLFFNPGSPTEKRQAPFRSIGILEVDQKIHGRIIRLDG